MIEMIVNSEQQTCAQSVLLDQFKITYPTLIATFDAVNAELKSFGFEAYVDRCASTISYSFHSNDGTSLQMITNAYTKASTKFQIMELLLTRSFVNIKELAESVHVSYNTLRGDIRELNEYLESKNLKISLENRVALTGDEISIRIFYTLLFLMTFGGESWPFSFINYFEISRLLDKCPNDIYVSGTLDKSMLIHYYVAIHLLRNRQGNFVSDNHKFEVPLYQATSIEEKITFDSLSYNLKKYLPNMDESSVFKSTKMMISVIIAFGTYSSLEKAPRFFFSEKKFESNGFLKIVEFILEEVSKELYIPFSKREKERLQYSLLSVNYRYFLFYGMNIEIESFIQEYSRLETNYRKVHKVNHLKRLIDELLDLSPLEALLPFRERLKKEYLIIFDKRIDLSLHTNRITIAMLSTISNEIAAFDIFNFFSNYYNLEISESLEPRVDLIISDFSISDSVLRDLRVNQPIVYVNPRLNEADYEKINQKLVTIAESKFINQPL